MRLLKHLDNPTEIEEIANFLKRQPSGGFVLHVAGKEGVEVVKSASREAENALVLAARKGEHGTAWLRTGNYRLLRPHPLLGLVKGVYKGTLPRAIERLTHEWLDPFGWLIIPAVALWLAVEVRLLVRRMGMATCSQVAVDNKGRAILVTRYPAERDPTESSPMKVPSNASAQKPVGLPLTAPRPDG
jgi:hypothetical protein